jgi:hypothetical protein
MRLKIRSLDFPIQKMVTWGRNPYFHDTEHNSPSDTEKCALASQDWRRKIKSFGSSSDGTLIGGPGGPVRHTKSRFSSQFQANRQQAVLMPKNGISKTKGTTSDSSVKSVQSAKVKQSPRSLDSLIQWLLSQEATISKVVEKTVPGTTSISPEYPVIHGLLCCLCLVYTSLMDRLRERVVF